MAKTVPVDQFMSDLSHPLKQEVKTVQEIIKGVNPEIIEQIKWNAPSFSYKGEYIVTFNLRPTDHIHLVFHNPDIAQVEDELLEGNYADRRMMYFVDAKDITAKKARLENVIKAVVAIIDKEK